MGWDFFDTDAEIEAAEKMPVAEIFRSRGEPEFRRVENLIIAQHVCWIERGRPAVLALGGGAFAQASNRDLLRNNGITVWLDCPFELVDRRVAALIERGFRGVAFFDAAVMIESGNYKNMDRMVVVVTDEETEAARLMARKGFKIICIIEYNGAVYNPNGLASDIDKIVV